MADNAEPKKIIILTASPLRDKLIDEMIADVLRAHGHEVRVAPCLREGRPAVLDMQPDLAVVPPIRNPYSRDMVETMKSWGMGVITRHTEASCDWQDFRAMSDREKAEIRGVYPYPADVELVWGPDEAQMLNQRGAPFKAVSVGAFSLDPYFVEDFDERYRHRDSFCQQYGLDKDKPTVMFLSCWSFADTAPDLHVDSMLKYKQEREARQQWIVMMQQVLQAHPGWNAVLKVHHDESEEPYKVLGERLRLCKEGLVPEFLANIDLLIHAGSTMAVEAHCCNLPAFRYVARTPLTQESWFTRDNAMGRVSPEASAAQIIEFMQNPSGGSNANPEALRELEQGRFGPMDGQATRRAAELILTVPGQFKMTWPRSWRNYETPVAKRFMQEIVQAIKCNVCGEVGYYLVNQNKHDHCVWCGTRILRLPMEQGAAHAPVPAGPQT